MRRGWPSAADLLINSQMLCQSTLAKRLTSQGDSSPVPSNLKIGDRLAMTAFLNSVPNSVNFFNRSSHSGKQGDSVGLDKQSFAKHEVVFSNSPAETAEGLISILEYIGKIKTVSRETGSIHALIKKGVAFGTTPHCHLQISSDDEGTRVTMNLSCEESLAVNYRRAEKALAIFLDEIGKDPFLKTSATTGW